MIHSVRKSLSQKTKLAETNIEPIKKLNCCLAITSRFLGLKGIMSCKIKGNHEVIVKLRKRFHIFLRVLR